MRMLIVALAIVFVSGSAYAQQEGVGGVPESTKQGSPAQAQKKKERAEAEKAYKKALDSIPDAGKPYDPWQGVRP